MKVIWLAYVQILIFSTLVNGSAISAPLDIISYDDISHEERKELDYLHQKFGRPKRSGSGGGSGDILQSLKLAIGQGIKNKIGEIAKGSAAASSRLSSSSSGHGYSYHPSPHPPEDYKSLDFWSLKKSIFNTLLQAVKAIKGGVIAVKGQLIKGGGYLTAATGKLIVAKGDAVTNLGKKIAASAVLVPFHGHPSSSGHAEYGPPPENHYSAPEEIYHGAPSAPAPEFHQEDHHYPHHDDDTHHSGPSGLLILKKIHGNNQNHHHVAESKVPPPKPVAHSGPGFATILGKFLSASSSLNPDTPEPFGNTGPEDVHTYSHSDHHYAGSETKNHHEVAPSASGYVVDEEDRAPEKESPPDDSPFEKEPSYLNQHFDEYVSSHSKKKPQMVKANSISQDAQKPSKDQEHKPSAQASVQNEFDYASINAPAPSGNSPLDGYNFYAITNLPSSQGEIPASMFAQTSVGQNLYYPLQSQPVIDFTKNYELPSFGTSAGNVIGQSQYSNDIPSYYNILPSQDPSPIPQSQTHHSSSRPTSHRRPTRLTHHDPSSNGSKHRTKSNRTKYSTLTNKRPTSSTRNVNTKQKPKQSFDVVKSVAYKLGPNGPQRLT